MKISRSITIVLTFIVLAICSGLANAQSTVRLKVLSMNIKEGGKYTNYKTAPFAEIIRKYSPDVVALQEVHDKTLLVGKRRWTYELGEDTGLFPLFCKSFDYRGGGFGVALLTKYPFFGSEYIVSVMAGAREPRATGWVYLSLPDGNTVRVGSTHIAVETECIAANMADINKRIFAEDNVTPTLLIGDFNSLPNSDYIFYFKRKWQDVSNDIGPTIPSDKPSKKLDYIMGYPKGGWKLDSYEVIARPDMSDHCFIYAEISFTEK